MKRRDFLKLLAGGSAGLAFGGLEQAYTQAIHTPRGDLRAFILSDINSSYGSTDYVSGIKQSVTHALELWQPDIVLSPGDLVAGQSHDLPMSRFPEMWAGFERHVGSRFRNAGIPFAPAMGNHDASSSRSRDGGFAFARERDAARAHWNNPAHDPLLHFVDRGDFPFYYAFVFSAPAGEVFVVVWDASSATISPAELEWAEAALGSDRARNSSLRLVIGHLPLYGISEGRNHPGEVITNGEEIRGMLERHSVHTYLSGHHHAYYPAKRGNLNLLHAGGVGARRHLGSSALARTTVTIMDISFGWQPEVEYTTFDIANFAEVGLSSLPPHIDGLNGRVTRLDLA